MGCTDISHLQKSAQAAKEYTDGTIAEVAKAASEALSEMDDVKADKSAAQPVVVPEAGWVNEGGDFPYVCDILVPGVTARDRVNVTIAPASVRTALDCGICPVSESLGGKVRIKTKKAPGGDMAAEIWIERGR